MVFLRVDFVVVICFIYFAHGCVRVTASLHLSLDCFRSSFPDAVDLLVEPFLLFLSSQGLSTMVSCLLFQMFDCVCLPSSSNSASVFYFPFCYFRYLISLISSGFSFFFFSYSYAFYYTSLVFVCFNALFIFSFSPSALSLMLFLLSLLLFVLVFFVCLSSQFLCFVTLEQRSESLERSLYMDCLCVIMNDFLHIYLFSTGYNHLSLMRS